MRMDSDVPRAMLEMQRLRFTIEQVIDKFFEKETARRDCLRLGQIEFAIILDKHRVTRRLEKEDWSGVAGCMEQFEIISSQSRGFFQVSLAEGGTSAAFAIRRKHDFETECFEDRDGGNADLRLVVADKSVIPKNDFAAQAAA